MNDLDTLKVNYNLEEWQRISEREGSHFVMPVGAAYAIRSLIDEIETLRAMSRELIRTYVVDNQYDPDAATDRAFKRWYAKTQLKK